MRVLEGLIAVTIACVIRAMIPSACPVIVASMLLLLLPHPIGADEVALPSEQEAEAVPSLLVEQPALDAGELLRGETASLTFRLKNVGQAPLVIKGKPNCNCTVARADTTIAPGDTGEINASLKTTGMSGRVERSITLSTNDPAQPTVRLTFAFNVTSVADVRRTEGKVLSLAGGGPTREQFEVQVDAALAGAAEPVQLVGVTCGARYAHVTLEPIEDQLGVYRVTLDVDESAPAGRSTLVITLATTSDREPRIVVQIPCEKGIITSPDAVRLGVVQPDSALPVSRPVFLRRGDGPFQVLKMECSDPALEVREEPMPSGRMRRFTVSYRGGATPGVHQGTLRIETDDPGRPVVEIPTHYLIPNPPPTAESND